MSFVKLHSVILTSTVWMLSAEERIVWITLLVMADQDGMIATSVPGLAHLARVDLNTAARALDAFTSPDPYSRTEEHEGRRLERVEGGFHLLNHSKFRELQGAEHRRALAAKRQDAWRKRNAASVAGRDEASRNALRPSPSVTITPSEAEAEAEAEAKETPDGEHAAPAAPPPKAKASARGTRLPEGWSPSEGTLAALRAEGHHGATATLASFRDYWAGVPGQRGVKLDWEGTYRNWVRRDATRAPGSVGARPAPGGRLIQVPLPEQADRFDFSEEANDRRRVERERRNAGM